MSLVDRASKYTSLSLVQQATAKAVTKAITTAFSKKGLPAKTMTYDNGKEFSMHQNIADLLGAKCYFATPYHSWERGLE